MTIEWEPITGYEGYYEVSNLGDIKRIVTYKGKPILRILKPQDDGSGYMKVRLYKQGKSKFFRVHRVVMRAFIGECPENNEVNHKDGDRANNSLDNLEYMTKSENNMHMYRVLGYKRRFINRKHLTKSQVIQIRELYATNEYSQVDLAEKFGMNRNTISNIVRRISWKHI